MRGSREISLVPSLHRRPQCCVIGKSLPGTAASYIPGKNELFQEKLCCLPYFGFVAGYLSSIIVP